jgi:hypothetical protein
MASDNGWYTALISRFPGMASDYGWYTALISRFPGVAWTNICVDPTPAVSEPEKAGSMSYLYTRRQLASSKLRLYPRKLLQRTPLPNEL